MPKFLFLPNQLKKEYPVEAKCIAYTEQGFICGRPATFLDTRRGGMVCGLHVPDKAQPLAQDPPEDRIEKKE